MSDDKAPAADKPRAYGLKAAAELLGISEHQVRRLVKAGKIRSRNTGRMYLIPAAAIEEYLDGADEPITHPDNLGRPA